MAAVTQNFCVVQFALDAGTLLASDRAALLGRDEVVACALSIGNIGAQGLSLQVERQALPVIFRDARWINRVAKVYEVEPGMGAVASGRLLFEGRVGAEPGEVSGLLSVTISPLARRVIALPDYGAITSEDYPQAPSASIGKDKPVIWGTVENCPLIPVQIQPWSNLAATAKPGDTHLDVRDATAFASSGSVRVDGNTYAYTTKTETSLLGMAIKARHKPGTLVAQVGDNVYLAAGHAVSAINTVRAGDAIFGGADIDLAEATLTYSDMPRIESGAERYTLAAQFDALAVGNNASNSGNAINYATGPTAQNATSKPTGVTSSAQIVFARPAGRIITAAYSVSFSVTVGGTQAGMARVRIGGVVAWTWQPGTGVIYNASPLALTSDADTDYLAVTVEGEAGGTLDVSVNINLASRQVYVGSLDDSDYATVAPGKSLKVTQTDALPDRGRIVKPQLHVRWFASDAALGTCSVKFDGVTLGTLSMTPSGNSILVDKTITIDQVTPGSTTLPAQSINTNVSGGTASLSALATARQADVTPTMGTWVDTANNARPMYTGGGLMPEMSGRKGNFTINIFINTLDPDKPGGASTSYTSSIDDALVLPVELRLLDANGSYLSNQVMGFFGPPDPDDGRYYHPSTTLTQVGGGIWKISKTFNIAAYSFEIKIYGGIIGPYFSAWNHIANVQFLWNATENGYSLTNVPASGSTTHSLTTAKNMSVEGLEVGISDGQIKIEVPAPPRVVDTLFDLSGFAAWSQFTNKTAEITLNGAGASVLVLLVELLIEFDEISYSAAVDNLTATVTGLDGNPAAVAKQLLEVTGERVEPEHYQRAYASYAAQDYVFARRVATRTDALQLLAFALQQGLLMAAAVDGETRLIRLQDKSSRLWHAGDDDLLDAAELGWSERVENDITVVYAEDPVGADGFAGLIQRNSANNAACHLSVADVARAYPLRIECGFIRDAAVAALFADAHAALFAPMRRTVALQLPFTYGEMVAGDLLDYDHALWRIGRVEKDNNWVSATAEELPA